VSGPVAARRRVPNWIEWLARRAPRWRTVLFCTPSAAASTAIVTKLAPLVKDISPVPVSVATKPRMTASPVNAQAGWRRGPGVGEGVREPATGECAEHETADRDYRGGRGESGTRVGAEAEEHHVAGHVRDEHVAHLRSLASAELHRPRTTGCAASVTAGPAMAGPGHCCRRCPARPAPVAGRLRPVHSLRRPHWTRTPQAGGGRKLRCFPGTAPEDPGLIALTVAEIKRLSALAARRLQPEAHHLHRGWWRRRHQARARSFHHRTRLRRHTHVR
jgi:hypothetical protein